MAANPANARGAHRAGANLTALRASANLTAPLFKLLRNTNWRNEPIEKAMRRLTRLKEWEPRYWEYLEKDVMAAWTVWWR